jgi:hypothetical protein
MRLNQLAKKVGKPFTRVEKYIRKDLKIEGIEGPNSKLDEDIVQKVISKFGLATDVVEEKPRVKMETVEAKPAEISPEERGLEEVYLDLATPGESVVPNLEGLGITKSEDSKEEIVDESGKTNEELDSSAIDDFVELTPNDSVSENKELPKEKLVAETVSTEDTVLHLDDEGTIIAPKVELGGITVKGKIEIPGVTDQVELDSEKDVELSPEELLALKVEEEARLEESRKKEEARRKKIDKDAAKAAAFKAQKEKEAKVLLRAKIEEEKKKKREEGKKHYISQVQQAPKIPAGKKKKSKKIEKIEKTEKNKVFETDEKFAEVENLTTWQKIVRWFNT